MATAHMTQLLHGKLFERPLGQYAFAIVMVAIAFILRRLLVPVTGSGAPFVLFFGAVLVTSLVAGPRAGILATVLGAPIGAEEFIAPGHGAYEAFGRALLFTAGCAVVLYLVSFGIRARRTVEKSEERLRLANEAAAIACWELDVASGQLQWSPQPLRPRPGPSTLEEWLGILHRDDRKRFERAHARSLDPKGDGAMRSEVRVVNPDGTVHWLSWVGRSYFRDNVPIKQVGTAIDVTDRRSHEDLLSEMAAELARSAKKCRDLITLAPDGFFLVDRRERITEVNLAACRMLGYERDELLGKPISDLLAPEEGARLEAARAQLLIPARVVTSEWTMRRKDGSRVYVEVSSNLVGDGDWQAFARDITERKRIDDERKVFVALVENSSDFIGIIDPSGTPVYLNPAGRRMVELPGETPIEHTRIPEYYAPELRAFASDVVVETVIERGRWRGETAFRNWRTDADIAVSEEHFKIFDASGTRLLGIGTIARDISETQRIAREREQLLEGERYAREQAEQANVQLRESEERFRLTLEHAPIGMALVALDGRFVRVNRSLCELVGYSADELVQLRFQDITHPDDLETDVALANQLIRGEIPRLQIEKRYVRKDGAVVTVLLDATILHGPDGAPLYFISQITDITERKHTEVALRFSEARFSGIISISSEAIISIDDDQRITLFNNGAEQIFGYTRAEAIGAPLEMLLPERFRAAHRGHVERFKAGPAIARPIAARHGGEVFGLRKNGEEFPAEAAISKLELDGSVTLTVVMHDITERRRVEREQRYLADVGKILSSSLDYEQTLTTVGELVVRELANWCIIQLAESESRPRRLRVIPDDPRLHPLVEEIERLEIDPTRPHLGKLVWDSQQPVVFERIDSNLLEQFAQSSDHLRLLQALEARSMMGVPLSIRGRMLGVLGFVWSRDDRAYTARDIPFAMALADRAAIAIENGRLYQSSLHASQLRDQVLGVVAHDLRTPLSLIQLQASMLQPAPAMPERRNPKPPKAILKAANRMNRLIQDLLDVSRIEAGQLSVNRAPVSPAKLVVDFVESERHLATAASLELEHELEQELPDIWADRDRIGQVFENMIGNAIKFTPAGGHITLGAQARGDKVVFWVADTGSGIAPDCLGQVFDRFWQATKGCRSGAGLGLPISRGIVEAHGGRIWVESTLGRGTTFYFTVPVAPAAAAPGPDTHTEHRPSP